MLWWLSASLVICFWYNLLNAEDVNSIVFFRNAVMATELSDGSLVHYIIIWATPLFTSGVSIRGVPAGMTRLMISQLGALWCHGVVSKSWQGPREWGNFIMTPCVLLRGPWHSCCAWNYGEIVQLLPLKRPCLSPGVRLTSHYKPFQNLSICDVASWRVHSDGQINCCPVDAVDHSTPSVGTCPRGHKGIDF